MRRLLAENRELRERLGGDTGFEGVVGSSDPMLQVFERVRKHGWGREFARMGFKMLMRPAVALGMGAAIAYLGGFW